MTRFWIGLCLCMRVHYWTHFVPILLFISAVFSITQCLSQILIIRIKLFKNWWNAHIFWIKVSNQGISSCFIRATVARMKLPFFEIFSNFVHFCLNFLTFCPFLPFFWKIPRMSLLSGIGPANTRLLFTVSSYTLFNVY